MTENNCLKICDDPCCTMYYGNETDTRTLIENNPLVYEFLNGIGPGLMFEALTIPEVHDFIDTKSREINHCVFYDNGCNVYDDRPGICRDYFCCKLVEELGLND